MNQSNGNKYFPKWKYLFCYIFVLQIGLSSFSSNLLAETIKFDANESPPFWSKSMVGNGMCGEILSAISNIVDLDSQIKFSPLKRLIEDEGNNDLGNPNFYMGTQSFAAIVPIAIYHTEFIYYSPLNNITINKLSDLKGYKIGALKGTLANRSYFEKAGVLFETSYSQDSLIKKMKIGRIDLSLIIGLVGETSIKKLYPNEIEKFVSIEIAGSKSPIAIMISEEQPNAEDIGKQIRAGLEAIIKNGSYQKILEKYYGVGKMPKNWLDDLKYFQQLYTI